MSNLTKHAQKELKLAGLFDKDSDYDGMIAQAVMELVKTFAKQGHSGFSARYTLEVFNEVANYRPLTPIGQSKDEWMDVAEMAVDGKGMWQNTRRGTTFSRDGGKTWYDIDDPSLDNGDTWKRPTKGSATLREEGSDEKV